LNLVKDEWIELEENFDKMKNTMIKMFLQSGFQQIDEAGYYAKNCRLLE